MDQTSWLAQVREDIIEPDLPIVAHDEDAIAQCVINLLSNAIKFTSDGDITIRLEEQQRDGMAGINLTVEDSVFSNTAGHAPACEHHNDLR